MPRNAILIYSSHPSFKIDPLLSYELRRCHGLSEYRPPLESDGQNGKTYHMKLTRWAEPRLPHLSPIVRVVTSIIHVDLGSTILLYSLAAFVKK